MTFKKVTIHPFNTSKTHICHTIFFNETKRISTRPKKFTNNQFDVGILITEYLIELFSVSINSTTENRLNCHIQSTHEIDNVSVIRFTSIETKSKHYTRTIETELNTCVRYNRNYMINIFTWCRNYEHFVNKNLILNLMHCKYESCKSWLRLKSLRLSKKKRLHVKRLLIIFGISYFALVLTRYEYVQWIINDKQINNVKMNDMRHDLFNLL